MVTTIGDFLQKVQEYQEKYSETKIHKSHTCIMNAQLFNLRTGVQNGEDYKVLKEQIYKKSMDACDLYIESYLKLSKYEDTLPIDEKEFVIQAGKTLSIDDIAYFSLQVEVGRIVEITSNNIEKFIEDVKELGYQSFRYNEAVNFVGTKETFETMFFDFYDFFRRKDELSNAKE